jgi:tRNA G18 (ribose-2'-O)-methylase SpoU
MPASNFKVFLILDNIRSVHNTGSIFRTADGVGVSKIYCLGTTPVPKDRFGRIRKDFCKVSLGAENTIEWMYVKNHEEMKMIIEEYKTKKPAEIIALEQSEKSVDYKDIKINQDTFVVLGNEVDGVSGELSTISDKIAEIPMNGQKESLNVAVSAGVFLYRVLGL